MPEKNGIASERKSIPNLNGEIYVSIVKNVLTLNESLVHKVSILMEAIPDVAIILSNLTLCKNKGLIDDASYNLMMQECLLQISKKQAFVKYNPLKFTQQRK